jgi:hypothetical protein
MNATFSSADTPSLSSRYLWSHNGPSELPCGVLNSFDDTVDDTKPLIFQPRESKPISAKARIYTSEQGIADEPVELLSKFEGYVVEISDDSFSAIMSENPDSEEILADFPKSDLSESDVEILAPGIPLIWTITKERQRGSIKRCSCVRVRRILRSTLAKTSEQRSNGFTPPN